MRPSLDRTNKGWLLPVAALFGVIMLVFTSGPAQAATYTSGSKVWNAEDDAGGINAWAWLDKAGVGGSQDYKATFYANDELLAVQVDDEMVSNAKITVAVYDKNGQHVDTDTFTVAPGTMDWLELGSPDGTGDIPEWYKVYVKICVGSSDTCTPYIRGRA